MDESLPKELVETYFRALEDEDYETLVAQFTEDVVYYHPLHGDSLHGHEEMVEFFRENRESREDSESVYHELDKWVISGNRFGLLGSITGTRGDTFFLAYGEVTDGKISFYIPALFTDIW